MIDFAQLKTSQYISCTLDHGTVHWGFERHIVTEEQSRLIIDLSRNMLSICYPKNGWLKLMRDHLLHTFWFVLLIIRDEWHTDIIHAWHSQKFYSSLPDLSCVIMITDTKKIWVEGSSSVSYNIYHLIVTAWDTVLNDKLLARRWRLYNQRSPEQFRNSENEEHWRESIFELLSKAHTIGGFAELSFEVVGSKYSVRLPNISSLLFSNSHCIGPLHRARMRNFQMEMGNLFYWLSKLFWSYIQAPSLPAY